MIIYNYFLDVLENGKMTSSQGEDIDLNGYIIIFTSNLTPQAFDNFLSPELRSRFNYIGIFQALKNKDKEKFVKRRMSDIIGKYNDRFEMKLPNYSHTLLCNRIDVNIMIYPFRSISSPCELVIFPFSKTSKK